MIQWGFIDFEERLYENFDMTIVDATFSNTDSVIAKHLATAISNLSDVNCVIYDGLAFIQGLSDELSKRDIPVVSYSVDFDEDAGHEFDDDVDQVIDKIPPRTSIR